MNACAAFVVLGIGAVTTPTADLSGDNPIAVGRLGVECSGLAIEYEHQSSIPDGPPVNDHYDQRWQERVVLTYTWRWKL